MLNTGALMGRLTRDPELKTTTNGNSVVSFTLAVDRNFSRDKTDFIPCVAWNKTAEFVSQYFHKGDMIALAGEIQSREFEYDGHKRTAIEFVANQVSFCGKKEEPKSEITENIDYEELPF